MAILIKMTSHGCEDKTILLKIYRSAQFIIAQNKQYRYINISKGILVVWLECLFLVTEIDGSNPGISMSCP